MTTSPKPTFALPSPDLAVLNLAKLSSEHERMERIANELADVLLPAWRDFETLNNTAIVGDQQPLVNLREALTKLTGLRTAVRSYLGEAVVLGTFLTEIVGVKERPSKREGGPTHTVVTFRENGVKWWQDVYTVGETNLNAASQDSDVIDKLRERWRALCEHSRPDRPHAESSTVKDDLIGRKVWIMVTLRNFGGNRYECVEVVPWPSAASKETA